MQIRWLRSPPSITVLGILIFTAFFGALLALASQHLLLYAILAPVTLTVACSQWVWFQFRVNHVVGLLLGTVLAALAFAAVGLMGNPNVLSLLEYRSAASHWNLTRVSWLVAEFFVSSFLYLLVWLPVSVVLNEFFVYFVRESLAWRRMQFLRRKAWSGVDLDDLPS